MLVECTTTQGHGSRGTRLLCVVALHPLGCCPLPQVQDGSLSARRTEWRACSQCDFHCHPNGQNWVTWSHVVAGKVGNGAFVPGGPVSH